MTTSPFTSCWRSPRFGLPVHLDRAFGEHTSASDPAATTSASFRQLPEPDDVVPGDDFAHAAIMGDPSASGLGMLDRIQTETCAGLTGSPDDVDEVALHSDRGRSRCAVRP